VADDPRDEGEHEPAVVLRGVDAIGKSALEFAEPVRPLLPGHVVVRLGHAGGFHELLVVREESHERSGGDHVLHTVDLSGGHDVLGNAIGADRALLDQVVEGKQSTRLGILPEERALHAGNAREVVSGRADRESFGVGEVVGDFRTDGGIRVGRFEE
jgi:hypothetical protein